MRETPRPLIVVLPPDPPAGLAPDAAAALGLGLLLDTLDDLAGEGADVRVAVEDPLEAPVIAAILPPGAGCLVLSPGEREAVLEALAREAGGEVRAVRAGPAGMAAPAGHHTPPALAAALDAAGTPSPSPRAWHLAHVLVDALAHSSRECQGVSGVRYDPRQPFPSCATGEGARADL